MREKKWILMVKFKESSWRGHIGLSKGHMWRRSSTDLGTTDWRPARFLEADIYANGITRIKDLSQL